MITNLRILSRRWVGALATRCANYRFLHSIAAVSVVSAKAAHIYAHIDALGIDAVLHWGLSFFAQDVALLMFLRLAGTDAVGSVPWLRSVASTVVLVTVLFVLALASFNISFFIVAGSELHWRNIGFAGDASSLKLLLAGLVSCLLVFAAILVTSSVVQELSYAAMSIALDIVKWPFVLLWNSSPIRRCLPPPAQYAHLLQQDAELAGESAIEDEEKPHLDQSDRLLERKWGLLSYAMVGISLIAMTFESIARPEDSAFAFMSWTLPLLPFVDFANSSPNLASMTPVYGDCINYTWDNLTALDEPISLPWLPADRPLPGFEDWYENKKHYSAAADPMRISNWENDLLPDLRGKLRDVKIRHVMIVKLEGTRKDVFPIKKHDFVWNQLAKSFKNKTMMLQAQDKLATLVPTANLITGDYDDGFPHLEQKRRGGINFNNALTTASYTLKSLTGTLCGLSPLVVDFNVEIRHHIYQPCLPQILEAFNQLDHSSDGSMDDFPSFKWSSSFMQSVTGLFDKQDIQMPLLGFPEGNIITEQYLTGPEPKFGPVVRPQSGGGLSEFTLEEYIRDTFATAKQKNERVFLTHLTGTTHHPFKIPSDEEIARLAEGDESTVLSKYLDTIGYVDGWLAKLLDILEEEGVADETLLVFVGDHGLCVAESNCITPYYAPGVANLHVPLVFSHPKLPVIDVEDAVTSHQILPTILDLLVETGSLSTSESQAARDLMRNYEGQSLLRPASDFSLVTGQPNWQFTIMNPGRAMLSVRDAHQPNLRVVVPIVHDIEWRFSNLTRDPHEQATVVAFDFRRFLGKVEREHSAEAAAWVEKAAFMSRWWVEENRRRWRFHEDLDYTPPV
ncbi:sulfatase domain protein [Ilyonectria sp. MPI-CAGE-AT-0026]|nr:sulfatase domain protein [Ilyonectria sp. MPI-CAGE-AT-0026]